MNLGSMNECQSYLMLLSVAILDFYGESEIPVITYCIL